MAAAERNSARRLLIQWSLAALPIVACSPPSDGPCEYGLMYAEFPDTVALVVGDTTTWTPRRWECNGRPVALHPRWATSDTAVLRVDATTGQLAARRPGWAMVTATDETHGRLVSTHVAVVW